MRLSEGEKSVVWCNAKMKRDECPQILTVTPVVFSLSTIYINIKGEAMKESALYLVFLHCPPT